jgi:N-acetylmuramoyl-L-alanine amidase
MLILAAVFAASLLLVTFSAPDAEAQTTTTGVLTGKKVVLDAGHRGSDPGASNAAYNLKEKDQNLDLAYNLKALLETSGTTVYMTPTGEQPLSNYDRYVFANTTGANVLVSIYINGSTNPGTDYTTTLYGKWQKDKELALRLFDGLRTLPAASGTSPIATRTPYQYAAGMLLKSNMPATMRRACSLPTAMRGGSSPKAPEPDSSR